MQAPCVLVAFSRAARDDEEATMSDNILQTLQHLVQDVIAPDVRELKVRLSSFEKLVNERFASLSKEIDTRFGSFSKEIDTRFASSSKELDTRFVSVDARFNSVDARFNSIDARFASIEERLDSQAKQMDAQFRAIMSAISESRAQAELAGMREIGELRERVAVIEARLPAKAS